jgi:threonine dehydrogenase-like Zn-dependent dehydrogenase
MKAQLLALVEPSKVELVDYDPGQPKAGEVLYRTVSSLISPGTGVAKFTGLQPVELPFATGYASCGEVLECGPGVTDVRPGELIFTYGRHATHDLSRTLYAKVPASLPPLLAPFVRLANVALTAVRVSEVELGDWVAVLGLGLVGNFASQLFRLNGAEVVGLDLSPRRRELATACGVPHVVDATGADGGVAEVKALTGGQGALHTVEAVGYPPLAMTACRMTARRGEVIWVGSPRGEWTVDATELLNQVHLWGNGCLTFKGAHEWRIPTRPVEGLKHSLLSGCRMLLQLAAERRLVIQPLHTHTLSPAEGQAGFEGLRGRQDEYVGVVFDWSRL